MNATQNGTGGMSLQMGEPEYYYYYEHKDIHNKITKLRYQTKC